uniref:BPTI/Kunitz inhibitor domain-containing protein n=1 Tax=Anolis carolinensis TaxID=28377 RepID=H9G3A1_ANOCA
STVEFVKLLLSFLSFLEETICSLPKKTGLCRAAFHRFYFNSETGQCESFTYGGCEGNANNFLTWDECFSKCEDKFICSLPRETGRCRRSFRRFYFDSKSGQCESFRYSGRGGNANNFLTQDDCVTKCGGKVKVNNPQVLFLMSKGLHHGLYCIILRMLTNQTGVKSSS